MITDVVMNNKNTAAWLWNDCHAAVISSILHLALSVAKAKLYTLPASDGEVGFSNSMNRKHVCYRLQFVKRPRG